ncbi:uncharacterized protein LOC141652751 [Silene latifolia]|uniref:uncharacterized protein LOC141652751 n=1 Tax=Silene latifolia TaxID=37657 RepID=UPI003D77FC5F
MEYLSRILDHVTTTMSFKFHPLCGSLQLSHLLFADDLVLFSKGDTHSIMILLRAFATFSIATGLQMNSMKSNIYFNGVHHSVKADIIEVSGFVEVLTSLYSYWANIFIIPKGVLRRIDALCRNYLWDSSTEFLRSLPVSWEKLSVPKCEGGLGVRNSYFWNAAAVGKLVWWIHSKPDALRVRWVNHIYMPWSSYSPKSDVAWSWKSICKLKNKFPLVFNSRVWSTSPARYSVSSAYDLIKIHYPLVPWYKYT